MSTNCLIVFDDGKDSVVLYRHWDGRPVMVKLLLKDFVEWYVERVAEFTGCFPHFFKRAKKVAAALIAYDLLRAQDARPAPSLSPTDFKKEEIFTAKKLAGEEYVYVVTLNEHSWNVKVYEKRERLTLLEEYGIDFEELLAANV